MEYIYLTACPNLDDMSHHVRLNFTATTPNKGRHPVQWLD